MDVFEALYTTRAMRRVSEDPIPEDILKQMVDAGIRAPSGSNRQGWKFIVVTDQEIKNQLVSPDCEAVEIYPNEDRLIDTANQYHLFVFPLKYKLPFGISVISQSDMIIAIYIISESRYDN